MGKKLTPDPEPSRLGWGCTAAVAGYAAAVLMVIGTTVDSAWAPFVAAFLLLPVLAVVAYRLYGLWLLHLAASRWLPRGIRGLLVYSESPHWQEYIETEWLPELGGKLETLNWSRRRYWRRSLQVRLCHHFVGRERNFNPSVIVLRGRRWPLVFRFYHAFRDAKHGDRAALRHLETRLRTELGSNTG